MPLGAPFWTAIVASERSYQDAQSVAQQVRFYGREVDILYSSDYSSLNLGYFVVYSGRFANRADALGQVKILKNLGFANTYDRWVAP